MSNAPFTPSTLKFTAQSPTLEDLQNYKKNWVMQAVENGSVSQLASIAATLAAPLPTRKRPWDVLSYYKLGKEASLLTSRSNFYYGSLHDADRLRILNVLVYVGWSIDPSKVGPTDLPFIEGDMVVRLKLDADNNYTPLSQEVLDRHYTSYPTSQLYLPGQWESLIAGAHNAALALEKKQKAASINVQRQELADELLIGKKI